jgi:Protein of unknown function (DUF2786)
MSNVVERIRALIALATNPAATEHEARNAALAACHLIASSGLEVRAVAPPPSACGLSDEALERAVNRGVEKGVAAAARVVDEMFGQAMKPRPCTVCGREVPRDRTVHASCLEAQAVGRRPW